jgi:hypothetical protein
MLDIDKNIHMYRYVYIYVYMYVFIYIYVYTSLRQNVSTITENHENNVNLV